MDDYYDIEAPMPRGDRAYVPPRRRYRTHAMRGVGKLAGWLGRKMLRNPTATGVAYGTAKMARMMYQDATARSPPSTPDKKRILDAPGAPKRKASTFDYDHNNSSPGMSQAAMEVDGSATANVAAASQTAKKRILSQMMRGHEGSANTRLPGCSYRLHAAKNISLPGILNDLFLPKLTSRLSFGFTSTTGLQKNVFPESSAANQVTEFAGAAPRGNYRGVSLLKFRFTDKDVTRQAKDALNATSLQIPTTLDGNNVNSCYRRFSSYPTMAVPTGGSANQVVQPVMQAIGSAPQSNPRQLGVGANLTHFEDHAYNATNFIQSTNNIAASISNVGTSFTAGSSTLWDGQTPILQGTGGSGDPFWYPAAVSETIMRISDGFVELDITNSSKTTCVVEIVLHSMKKTAKAFNSPEVYQELFNSYTKYTQQLVNAASNPESSTSNVPGGWQTFYDPDVPLLSCPKKHLKNFNNLASEVHRSNHILGVGQSKTVKISLGGLYYKLGNKSENVTEDLNDALKNYSKRDNAGTILCAIGHTGFDAMETMGVPGTSFKTDSIGSGLWAGKTPSPSSLLISGKYQEQYYPMYSCTTGRILGNHAPLRSSFLNGTLIPSDELGLPLAQLVSDYVVSVDADAVGAPLGNKATTEL